MMGHMEKMKCKAFKNLEADYKETFAKVAKKYIRREERKAGRKLKMTPQSVFYLFSRADQQKMKKAQNKLVSDKHAVINYLHLI